MARRTILFLEIASLLTIGGGMLRADMIKLRGGGEVRGQIATDTDATEDHLTIVTLAGSRLVIHSDDVVAVVRRPLVYEEYMARTNEVADTIEAHWDLAEWCREQNLDTQRDFHLRQILEIDPEHERAHYSLGHVQHQGRWTTREQVMRERGYVKYGRRYVTQQERELLQQQDAEDEAEQAWYQKIRRWHSWLTSRSVEQQQAAVQELKKLRDPSAVPALRRLFADSENFQLRRLYIHTLGQILHEQAVAALVHQSLGDANLHLRSDARHTIPQEGYEVAMDHYIQALASDFNPIVSRAAAGLELVGDERAIPALIKALVTTHKYRMRVPDRSSALSFSADGSMVNPNQLVLPPDIEVQLRTGQLPYGVTVLPNPSLGSSRTRLVTFQQQHQNERVLMTLKKLTGLSYGYDEAAWSNWWMSHGSTGLKKQKTP